LNLETTPAAGGGCVGNEAEESDGSGNWNAASAVALVPGTGERGTGETIRVVDGVLQ